MGAAFAFPGYPELFRVPDGETVRITNPSGEQHDRVARYIDDCHVEVGKSLYHICELAEKVERSGSIVIPLRSSLPDKCWGILPSGDEIITIRKGEKGYYRTDRYGHDREAAQQIVDEYNQQEGVTKAQAAAMLAGSLFGWGCPAADPKNYDEQGRPIKPKHHDRGDAR